MEVYDNIMNRIKENPDCGDLYYELGVFLENNNRAQAYLCYENALYLNKKDEKTMAKLHNMEKNGDKIPKTAIVILSYNNKQLIKDCIESIRETTPEEAREIIVVDNASKDDSVEYLKEQKDVRLKANSENSGFPKGCNEGIMIAEKDSDILLLNNDTIMMPHTLFWLRMGLYESDNIGSAGSVSNFAANQSVGKNNQNMDYYRSIARSTNVPMRQPYEYRTWLSGFCVLFKRSILEKIGYLDEQFSPGFYEDNDIGLRVYRAGYVNVLVKNSYLVHLGGKSFGLNPINERMIINKNKIDIKYHGDLSKLYFANDMICEWVDSVNQQGSFLEIGCGIGATLIKIKSKYPQMKLYGITDKENTSPFVNNNSLVNIAFYYDIEEFPFGETKFDYICLDTRTIGIKSLNKYIGVLKNHLSESGQIYVLVDNAIYFTYVKEILVDGKIPELFREGIVTENELLDRLTESGFIPSKWFYYFLDVPEVDKAFVDDVTKIIQEDNNQMRIIRKAIVAHI